MSQLVSLSPLAENHLLKMWNWIHEESIQNGFLISPPSSFEMHEKWFVRVKDDKTTQQFAILYGDEHVGICGLKSMDMRHGRAELFIYLDPGFSGKGIASNAIKCLKKFSFREFKLRKLYLHVHTQNFPAIFLYLRNGFIFESIQFKELIWRDKEMDIYRMICLPEKHFSCQE